MVMENLNEDIKFKFLALKSLISIINKCVPNIYNYFSQKLIIGLLVKLKIQWKCLGISLSQNIKMI